MKYTVTNGIHIVEVPLGDFRIDLCDAKKKSAAQKDYCNAGFFATYHEKGSAFTLPVAHLKCDYSAASPYTKKYCEERGSFEGNKFCFDSSKWSYMNDFCNKKVSTLLVYDDMAYIVDTIVLPKDAKYAISGVPIMRDGKDVQFKTYVVGQGWDASSLYATWHTFIGTKQGSKAIYVMGMKTTRSNMITSAEAFKKFRDLGMYNVIKLDGGGSFYFNVGGKAVASTLENRLINTIIRFDPVTPTQKPADNKELSENKPETNPFVRPAKTLVKWSLDKEGVRWAQFQLNRAGCPCDIDGKYGPDTVRQVKEFQRAHNLKQDGKVGPITRAALEKY